MIRRKPESGEQWITRVPICLGSAGRRVHPKGTVVMIVSVTGSCAWVVFPNDHHDQRYIGLKQLRHLRPLELLAAQAIDPGTYTSEIK